MVQEFYFCQHGAGERFSNLIQFNERGIPNGFKYIIQPHMVTIFAAKVGIYVCGKTQYKTGNNFVKYHFPQQFL